MTPTAKIAEGYTSSTASLTRDERVAAAYRPDAMCTALEALAQRDDNALTPTMRMTLGYARGAQEAAERVARGEAQ